MLLFLFFSLHEWKEDRRQGKGLGLLLVPNRSTHDCSCVIEPVFEAPSGSIEISLTYTHMKLVL